jgi:large conductance mechanosensitive channel
MSFQQEFKDVIMRGNVVDLAVGVVIGGAFGKIVDSLVNDIVMPPIGLLTGKGFTDSFVVLKPAADGVSTFASLDAARKAGAVVLAWGNFITIILNFLIIAMVIFMIVKAINRFRKAEEAAPAEPTPSEALLTEIRDLLRNS